MLSRVDGYTQHRDLESPSSDMSTSMRRPLRSIKQKQPANGGKPSFVYTILRFVGSGIFGPDTTTYDPLVVLLNEPDRTERDRLTAQWRDNKLAELNFVGIVSALICGCLTSTGSWPTILPNGRASPWPVRCAWYCGIVLSLASILFAADQTIRLHRLSTHKDALVRLRRLLGDHRTDSQGRKLPRSGQSYTWQLPVLFLAMSVICMLVGMFVLVWSATWHPHPQAWWDENSKVAVTFTIVAFLATAVFFAGQITLFSASEESSERDDD